MSKRSDSPFSDRSSLDLSDGSSASEVDSDNSRDVNLNSKKFIDSNLFGTEVDDKISNNNKIDESDLTFASAIEDLNTKYNFKSGDNEKTEGVQNEKSGANPGNAELENSNHSVEAKNSALITTSTPKPEAADCQSFFNLFTISTDVSPAESGSEDQTCVVAKTVLNQSTALTNEEIGKKFRDLSFAFKTDSMTIQKRLQLMKRRRDQAESNIENELGIIKAKLKTLQYIGLNSECINVMTDLKKQLDFVLNATIQLSSSAEGYGYAQHEERLLDLIAIMLQHVENVESSKVESPDKLKKESQRSPMSVFLDNARDDEKILRRRGSVAVTAFQGNCRRRASIATLPRIGNAIENGSGKGLQWNTPNRSSGCAAGNSRSNLSNLGTDDVRDSAGVRLRRESRVANEVSMTNIDEAPEQRPSVVSELMNESVPNDDGTEVNDSSAHLKQLFESIEEVRRNSGPQEQITAAHCLRRIIEWNKLLLSSARFRWPENVLQYAPFYITWYIVFVLTLVFFGGLFTGINGCYTYSCLNYSALWLAAPAFYSFSRRYYRFLLLLSLTLVFAFTLLFFWLTRILLPQLSNEEIDSLFGTLGLEIRYLNGPPPV